MFCLSRNKLTRLPLYLSKFRNLNILKVDRNPLAWPPQSVMERPGNADDARAMKNWIQGLQTWMEEDCVGHADRKNSEESLAGSRHV